MTYELYKGICLCRHFIKAIKACTNTRMVFEKNNRLNAIEPLSNRRKTKQTNYSSFQGPFMLQVTRDNKLGSHGGFASIFD